MRVVDIIAKKRDNYKLTEEEIHYILDKYINKEIPDYQMSAFLMAIYFNGLDKDEIAIFTDKFVNSGDIIELEREINSFIIDKHSTGGVGDKVTIALLPIFSSLGIGTLKLSGKGLGHTGGTIDKLESINNFKFPNTKEELLEKFHETNIGIMGYTDKIVPLDKEIYSLRDVTATVSSLPLIAISVMSKKLVIPSNGIILDIKVGKGAFIKNIDDGEKLSDIMIDIGRKFNKKMVTILSNMDEPLGNKIGNALEIEEVIEILNGDGPKDLRKFITDFTAIAINMKNPEIDYENGKKMVEDVINSKKALDEFRKMIDSYGGDSSIIDNIDKLGISKNTDYILADKTGYVKEIDTEKIGIAVMKLGAGRETKDDTIDYSVGLKLYKKIGDYVKKEEKLFKVYHKNNRELEKIKLDILNSYLIVGEKVEKKPIILKIKGGDFIEHK